MAHEQEDETRIPLMEEAIALSKRAVETGHVQVRTIVEEHTQNVVAELERERIDVTRRSVNRQVDSAPVPYDEDGCWIVPIVEERLVVEKRLFVTEEIVMRRSMRTVEVSVPTTLRTMRAEIDQADDNDHRRD